MPLHHSTRRLLCHWRLALGASLLLAFRVHANDAQPSDPYLWLEEVTGERALDWVKEQNKESTAELTQSPEFHALNRRLLEILDSKERIPYIAKRGEFYYNFWRDEKNPRGLWRRTSLAEYRQANPRWEIVLDLDALAAAEKENWVWKGSAWLEPTYDRCVIRLSRGGADASVVREFNPQTKTFVPNGFNLPEAKSNFDWRDADSAFVGTDFGPGSLTESGYPRIVKEWRRGQPLPEAKLVFEGKPTDVSVSGIRDNTRGFERDFIHRSVSFYESELFLLREGKLIPIEKPSDANATPNRDLLLVQLRSPWSVAGTTFPAGALLATEFEAFLNGERKFDRLFEPSERTSLEGFGATRHYLLLNELDNVASRIEVLRRESGAWKRSELPGLPKYGNANVASVDADDSDEYFLTVDDYLTPVTLSLGTAGGAAASPLKQAPAFFNTNGLTVSQHFAISKDGTKVPYFQLSQAKLPADGKARTLLYGYGGFEISLTPGYSGLVGAGWLERGGVYVVANIRGGGEFGPTWHQAALKEKRHRAYEDFAAVAEDLIRRQVTEPKHLGIEGGSNGGLLVGNMLTLYPQLFGAVVCQVPLLDMRRYHQLLAGASWMAEYGNPDRPEEWEFVRTFSPYHNVKSGVKYPRTLFTTSTRDDRVHPAHARKMVARMKALGADVLYYENIEGGHGGAADNKQRAYLDALAYTFLWKELE